MMNIKDMSMNFDIASREYYILRELHLYMNEKINDTIEIPSYLSSWWTLHPYMLYSSMAYDAALAAWKTIVINFRASWCPRCKATSEEIIAHMSDIPSNVIVLEADYDGTKDLQDLYWVTMQTTFVFFDTAWNVSKKVEKLSWIDELLKELE